MNSQASIEATQQISQSFYDELLSRRLAKPGSGIDLPNGERTETQLTVNEGEDGHIDIASSFVVQNGNRLEENDSVDIGSTQTQSYLTQFPESQRFKTPAPLNRKRRYDGQMVESPVVSKNPLARNGQTPAHTFGLSQAFAGTQAGSSPFVIGLPQNPLSDRPSPLLDQSERPRTATSSSPLLPIHEIPRASTEPAVRYVSVRQSQTRRVNVSDLPSSSNHNGINEEDSDQEPSIITRIRKDKERKAWIRTQFEAASSPPPSSQRDLAGGQYTVLPNPDSDNIDNREDTTLPLVDGSEAETDYEDDYHVTVRHSSHTKHAGIQDKENLANFTGKIPDTVLRPAQDFEVQASPLLRYPKHNSSFPTAEPLSSEAVRVDDSQPSPSQVQHGEARRMQNSLRRHSNEVGKSSHTKDDATDAANSTNNTLGLTDHAVEAAAETYVECDKTLRAESITSNKLVVLSATVPETASSKNTGSSKFRSSQKDFATDEQDTGKASFVSQSRGQDRAASPDYPRREGHNMDVSPIKGSRRNLMVDIAAELSPRRSGTQSSFNALDALALDTDPDVARELRSLEAVSFEGNIGVTSTRQRAYYRDGKARNQSANSSPSSAASSPPVVPKKPVTIQSPWVDLSQEVVKPNQRRLRNCRSSGRVIEPMRDRPSTWDIQSTPETHVSNTARRLDTTASKVPKSKIVTNGKSSRKAKDLAATQKQEQPLRVSKNTDDSPDPIAISMNDTCSLLDETVVAPNMVFACFNGKSRAYYPALCLGQATSNASRLLVQWEGYDPDEIDVHGVRSLDLRIGDLIKINKNGLPKIPYCIKGFADHVRHPGTNEVTDIRGHKSVILQPKQRKSLPTDVTTNDYFTVPVSTIYLDSNMWVQMKDRMYTHELKSSTKQSTGICTPIERPSTPMTPSSRTRRPTNSNVKQIFLGARYLFTNMVFAVSFDDPVTRSSICKSLEENGATVITNGFDDLFEPNLQLKPAFINAGFSGLLTDKHSRKEKYMQALALGLPCLSGRWVDACVKKQKLVDWIDYLLPAGESTELDDVTRSRYLPFIEPSTASLSAMISARPKFFDGARVMFLTGRGKAEIKRTPYLFFLEAMRAGSVERASDLRSLEEEEVQTQLSQCSWLLVDDKDLDQAKDLIQRISQHRNKAGKLRNLVTICRVDNNEMIKQSLILGRLYEADS